MADAEILDNKTPAEQQKIDSVSSSNWLAEIAASEKNLEKWHEQGRKIVRRFLDRRDDAQESMNKINLFTSNTGILISTLYARFPKPMVTREHEDQDDDVARVAATMMERVLKIRPRDDMDSAMRNVVQDRLVPGCGTVWIRYDPTIEVVEVPPVIDEMTGQEIPQDPQEQLVDEKVVIDYVFWEDIRWSPARTWDQVRWVGRRVKMTKADAEKRFGEAIAARLTYRVLGGTGTDSDRSAEGEKPSDKVEYTTVYEIWCKRTKKVYWVSKGFEFLCDTRDDPLKLKEFWPTPKFLMALTSTSNLVPRADFLLAQDQYEELDMVNQRITMLERAIKVVGVYDGTNDEIQRIFTEAVDNTIIPSRSFREFMEKGGMKGAIDWLPIEAIVNALEKLRTYRQDLISQIYEVTGISDIMRGSTKATETATAQNLKAQYGSVKLQHLQMEVAAFVEEALEIKAEIVRNFFQPETILRLSNIERTPDAPFVQEALALIKSPEFDMRVEVHADSMAVPEFNAERDGRMGFMRAISEMMTAAAPILEKSPAAGIAMLQVIQWGAASFRTGNTIESALDTAINEIKKAVKEAEMQPPPPPPPDVVAKAKKDDTQGELNMAKVAEIQATVVRDLNTPIEDPNKAPPAAS